MNERPGSSFEGSEVVDLYVHRPPYPEAVFEKLLELAPRHDAALDIGCGPGKVSRPLTRSFASVVAVDPSQKMIALGQSLPDGRAPNLLWINSLAEDARLDAKRFDLTVAAASIHWMDLDRLFPKLTVHAAPGHVFAAISGDDAFEPPWDTEWKRFLGKWVPEVTGKPFDVERQDAVWSGYRRHLELGGSEYFTAPVSQSVEDFIKCQHSRDTWAYSRLGSRTEAFDTELAEILEGHATNGQLDYTVRTLVTWGTIPTQ
jgi:SAM-dependent methyltransferase